MDNLPPELQDEILNYIFSNNCYISDKCNNNLKKCACVSKIFNEKFECKPSYFYLSDKEYIEFCCIHDRILLENCISLFTCIIQNYNFNFNYFVDLKINNTLTNVPLSVFNLEPYISLMDDNYFFLYHLDTEYFKNLKEIIEIKERVIKVLFSHFKLKFSDKSNGSNNEKLKDSVGVLKDLVTNISNF